MRGFIRTSVFLGIVKSFCKWSCGSPNTAQLSWWDVVLLGEAVRLPWVTQWLREIGVRQLPVHEARPSRRPTQRSRSQNQKQRSTRRHPLLFNALCCCSPTDSLCPVSRKNASTDGPSKHVTEIFVQSYPNHPALTRVVDRFHNLKALSCLSPV